MKKEFLESLLKLLESLNEFERAKAVQFYSELIDDKKESGMTEEQAVASLGEVKTVAEKLLSEKALERRQTEAPLVQRETQYQARTVNEKPPKQKTNIIKIILWSTAFIWIFIVFGLGIVFLSVLFSLTAAYFGIMIGGFVSPFVFIFSLIFDKAPFSYILWQLGATILFFGIALLMVPLTKKIFTGFKICLVWIFNQFKKLFS